MAIAFPEHTRREMCDRFGLFFTLYYRQKESTVGALSEQERKAMEGSLREFSQLPPDKRRYCVMAFGKFATMSPAEQNQFLAQRAARAGSGNDAPGTPAVAQHGEKPAAASADAARFLYKTSPHGLPPMPRDLVRSPGAKECLRGRKRRTDELDQGCASSVCSGVCRWSLPSSTTRGGRVGMLPGI